MVLREAKGDPRGTLTAQRAALGQPVLPGELDRGRVVVEFLQPHGELACGRDYDLGQQAAAIDLEETIQGPPELVIAQKIDLVGREGEHRRAERADNFMVPVDRLALDHDGTYEY